jgi:hypothetical protein
MEPSVLRAQLRSCLSLRLTRPESRALVEVLDDGHNGAIIGEEFLSHFFRIGAWLVVVMMMGRRRRKVLPVTECGSRQ